MRDCFNKVFCEYMNIHDSDTRKQLLAMDEADQNTVLLTLTGKLYEMIISKTTDIDFGDIPDTKGDITELESYGKIRESINVLTDILTQFHQPTETIDTIRMALDNLENDASLYKKGFVAHISLIETTYNTIALSIVSSISYMIAVTVDFVKNPHDGHTFKASFDKAGIARTKDSLVYENLVRFNNACKEGQIEAAFKPLIKNKVRNLVGSGLTMLATGIAVAGFLVNILPIIRELTYFYYASNTRISQYFDLQADLLEMNAQMIKSGEVDSEGDRKIVAARQLSIASRFRKIANFFMVNIKKNDKEATNMIKQDNKVYKLNDVVDQAPDSVVSSPLF